MIENIVFTPFEVIHDKMGTGVAIGYCEKDETTYIKIRFSNHEIQDFVFPDQFEWHLKATEAEVQNQIRKIIRERRNPVKKQIFLRCGIDIWKRAMDVYDFGCKKFDWDPKKRGFFDRNRILYAADATSEGYAVWCLAHHDMIEPYNEDQSWYNYILGNYIEEVWFVEKPNFYYDDSTRVTFIKKSSNRYEFFGVYTPIKHEIRVFNGKSRKVKIYQKISEEYPI